MERYLRYYKTKIVYILIMIIPSLYLNYIFTGYIDYNTLISNIIALHASFLMWEYWFPTSELFSLASFCTSLQCLFMYPALILGAIITLKLFPYVTKKPSVINSFSFGYIILFIFFFLLALDHSRCNSDL